MSVGICCFFYVFVCLVGWLLIGVVVVFYSYSLSYFIIQGVPLAPLCASPEERKTT